VGQVSTNVTDVHPPSGSAGRREPTETLQEKLRRLVRGSMTRQHPARSERPSKPAPTWALLPLLTVLSGCWSSPPSRPEPVPVAPPGVALDTLPLAVVDLPSDVRDGRPPPEHVRLGPWEPVEAPGRRLFRTRAPIRPRATFHGRSPRGIQLFDGDDQALPYTTTGLRRWWSYDQGRIVVSLPDPQEQPDGISLASPLAQRREARLNPDYSGIDSPDAFVQARLQVQDTVHEGLLLPAPAHIAVDVHIPPAGELHLTPLLLPPEVADRAASDGASVVVDVEVDGTRSTAWHTRLAQVGPGTPARVDLSRWAEQDVRLHLTTEPGPTSTSDYVFLADPVLAPREQAPQRVVMVFVDTLRADHLGVYGAERQTSPWIDGVGARGTVFEQARSVSSWTLPSYRSMITGRRPTAWDKGPTLGQTLRERGFATALIGANLYLSEAFGGARGFGLHHVEHLAPADVQVDRAIAWLDRHTERDALLVLHLMDPHLPYTEPEAWRTRFAGPTPKNWPPGEQFLRNQVRSPPGPVRSWIIDRYDNNIAWLDHELSRLDAHLSDQDLLIIVSDHGEEFWDHGGFEHGHSLHTELVRVPLILAGPGLPATRRPEPVSLLDLSPTVLDWLDVDPPADLAGRSLLQPAPAERPLPLGHMLYGFERWGVVRGPHTWTTHRGREQVLDTSDDDAARPVPDSARQAWHRDLSIAHGHPVSQVVRLGLRTRRGERLEAGAVIELVPDRPVVKAWLGEDASPTRTVELQTRADGAVEIRFASGWRGSRDIYVQLEPEPGPGADTDSATDTPMLLAVRSPPQLRPRIIKVPPEPLAGADHLLTVPIGNQAELRIGPAVVPRPADDDAPTSGFDPELQGMLERAGYLIDGQD